MDRPTSPSPPLDAGDGSSRLHSFYLTASDHIQRKERRKEWVLIHAVRGCRRPQDYHHTHHSTRVTLHYNTTRHNTRFTSLLLLQLQPYLTSERQHPKEGTRCVQCRRYGGVQSRNSSPLYFSSSPPFATASNGYIGALRVFI